MRTTCVSLIFPHYFYLRFFKIFKIEISQIISPTEAIFEAKGAHPSEGDTINITYLSLFSPLYFF